MVGTVNIEIKCKLVLYLTQHFCLSSVKLLSMRLLVMFRVFRGKVKSFREKMRNFREIENAKSREKYENFSKKYCKIFAKKIMRNFAKKDAKIHRKSVNY